MSLTEELQEAVKPLWEKMVTHPFVRELGDGTLPEEKFKLYFQQDHLFLRDWISLLCLGIARAPDFDAARKLSTFMSQVLGGEEDKDLHQTKMAQRDDTRKAIQFAIEEARKLGHKYVGTEHLLLGCLREGNNLAARVLSERGVKLDPLREEILTLLRSATDDDHAARAAGHDGQEWLHQGELAKAFRSPRFWHRLVLAVESANRLGHGEIEDEHLLLALLREPDCFVGQMLAEKGVTADWVRERITRSSAL